MAETIKRGRGGRGEPERLRGAAASAVLTSRENRWVKEFRMALRGGVATSAGAVGVEGVRLVEEALTSGCRMEAVLFSESGERYREKLAPMIGRGEIAFPVLHTTDRLFAGIADTEHPQGVAALVQPRQVDLADLYSAREGESEPMLVVLAGVQDPGNVGAILRTAAAFGATGAVTAATGHSGTANPYGPKALRASAGAALHLPIVAGMALGILLTQFKLNGITTLATCLGTEARDALAPWEVDWNQAVAVLVGNEGAGLPEEVLRGADARLHVPMATFSSTGNFRVESLNAAAAATVVLYEGWRGRKRSRVG